MCKVYPTLTFTPILGGLVRGTFKGSNRRKIITMKLGTDVVHNV